MKLGAADLKAWSDEILAKEKAQRCALTSEPPADNDKGQFANGGAQNEKATWCSFVKRLNKTEPVWDLEIMGADHQQTG